MCQGHSLLEGSLMAGGLCGCVDADAAAEVPKHLTKPSDRNAASAGERSSQG